MQFPVSSVAALVLLSSLFLQTLARVLYFYLPLALLIFICEVWLQAAPGLRLRLRSQPAREAAVLLQQAGPLELFLQKLLYHLPAGAPEHSRLDWDFKCVQEQRYSAHYNQQSFKGYLPEELGSLEPAELAKRLRAVRRYFRQHSASGGELQHWITTLEELHQARLDDPQRE